MPEDPTPIQTALAELNRTIHEPARLAILTVLSACATADFLFLEFSTGLSRGNLSVQLTRLEEAGFITTKKTIERKQLIRYWAQMERIRKHATQRQKKSKKPLTSKPSISRKAPAPNPVRQT